MPTLWSTLTAGIKVWDIWYCKLKLRVEAFLENLGFKRSYEAAKQRVQRFGSKLKGYVETGKAKL